MPHNKPAYDWLDNSVEKFTPTSSFLYVGWRKGSYLHWVDYAKKLGAERIGLLEIFKPNLAQFDVEGIEKHLGDIADLHKMFEKDEWHTVHWDHGPEHALNEEWLGEVTKMLKKNVKRIIYGCPWGLCPQKASYGNDREEHAVTVTKEMLEGFDMEVAAFNTPDTGAGGELIGWWERDD